MVAVLVPRRQVRPQHLPYNDLVIRAVSLPLSGDNLMVQMPHIPLSGKMVESVYGALAPRLVTNTVV